MTGSPPGPATIGPPDPGSRTRDRRSRPAERSKTALALFPLAIGALLIGCVEATDEAPRLALDLTACLGPRAAESSGDGGASGGACRAAMIDAARQGAAGCLVIRTAAGDVLRHEMVWRSDGTLATATDAGAGVTSGQVITSALFLGLPAPCAEVNPDTPCTDDPTCLLKLGPVEQTVVLTGLTLIDFAPGGACVVEGGSYNAGIAGEPCDGADNDCDGRVDEAVMGACTVGTGACALDGDRQICNGGARVCADADSRLIPDANRGPDTDCDGIDTDCDGNVDEGGACDACAVDRDCVDVEGKPQCVDDACRGCDPADGAGCDMARPICDAEDNTCRTCEVDAECDGGLVCTPFVGCTACDPARADTCPLPELAVCDPATNTCRGCRGQGQGDCPEGYCFAGRCGACDPASAEPCQNPAPICNVGDRTCRGCQNDPECGETNPDTPVCRQGTCIACEVGTNEGCLDPAAPICAGDPLRCMPCDATHPCPFGSCQEGRCIGCEPGTNLGCLRDSNRPICDPSNGNPTCRGCQGDGECPDGRFCSAQGRCGQCLEPSGEGCDPASDAPVCRGGICRTCADDAECLARDGNRDQCTADGTCQLCDRIDNAGCIADGNTPVCRDGACAGCQNDAECNGGRQCLAGGRCAICDPQDNAGCPPETAVCNPDGNGCRACQRDNECSDGLVCVTGRCVECDAARNDPLDPLRDLGCDAAAPVCEAGRCRGCRQDAECGIGQCVAGQCRSCDPQDNAGCLPNSPTPICGNDFICRGCAVPNECGRGGLAPTCDTGTGACVPCVAGTNLGCGGATPICRGNTCQACRAGECGAQLCAADGFCRACLPANNQGCNPIGNAAVCDAATYACRGCDGNAECLDPNRRFCVEGTCLACNPSNNQGCLASSTTPRCVVGVCAACSDDVFCARLAQTPGGQCLNTGACAACDPITNDGCVPDGIRPVCSPEQLACDNCITGVCSLGDCVADGRCIACDPANRATCVEDPFSAGFPVPPICDPTTRACVACGGNPDCVGHPYGGICDREGFCACDINGRRCDLSSSRPICSGAGCRACNNDSECIGNPYGPTCDREGAGQGGCR